MPGVDVGIVVTNGEAALRFYRDVLGLVLERSLPIPGRGTLHMLRCGDSMVKVAVPAEPPALTPPADPWARTGFRYLTITVDDIDEVVAACAGAGHPVVVGPIAYGDARVAMVTDPDGNAVEFLQPAP